MASCAAFGDEATTDRALAGTPALHVRAQGLQTPGVLARRHADEHLFDHPPVQRIGRGHRLKRRQRDLTRRRPHPWTLDRHLPAAQHDFALGGAGPAGRPVRLVGVPRPADRGAIFFEHGGEDLQPRSQRQFQQLGLRLDQQVDERQMAQRRFGVWNGRGYARLLHGGSFL